MVPQNCSVSHILQNIFLCVQQNKHIQTVIQHIRMISEGSCDTEDWSYDAKNVALITGFFFPQ